ncbi:MAG TPA: pyrroline-5-carboxylate reductase [Steroidobacteraceae bacterium]|jgi:pyrroline-5-carboxylate reductase|nr:pyrroline-5-carboxylate reductase [Steroidobacteraceae bacterium]
MSHIELTVLGAGNMGRALIGGLLRHGMRPEQITVGESREAARAALAQELGIAATADNAAAIAKADLVVLAVKPQHAGSVLAALAPQLQPRRPIVLSVAAGVRIQALQSWCGAGVPVIRAMPNRPAFVGAGVTGLYAPAEIGASQRATAAQIMQSVGEVVWVATEEALDVVTALSGSGPAYFFLLAEAMMQAGVELGLPVDTARRLSIATLHGAGLLAQGSDGDLARLRTEVTSKGGTTEAALRTLQAADFNELICRAVAAAARRSRELAEQFGGTRSQPHTDTP